MLFLSAQHVYFYILEKLLKRLVLSNNFSVHPLSINRIVSLLIALYVCRLLHFVLHKDNTGYATIIIMNNKVIIITVKLSTRQ